MPSYARIVDGVAVELFTPQEGFTLEDSWHPEVATLFTEVPANVTVGSTVDDKGKWTIAPAPVEPVAPIVYPKVSPMTFQMLFTSPERIAIRTKVAAPDPVLADWWDIVTNPQLTEVDLALSSVQSALAYLVTLEILTEDRKAQVLTGIIQ